MRMSPEGVVSETAVTARVLMSEICSAFRRNVLSTPPD